MSPRSTIGTRVPPVPPTPPRALEDAERAEADARTALGVAVAEAPLAQASHDLNELGRVLAEVVARRAVTRNAHEEQESAEAAVARARDARGSRQRDLDDANRAHVVAGLRPHLTVGEACPVCEQTVGTLPGPVHAPELSATQERLQDADQSLVFAQQRAQRLGTAAAKADAALSAKLDRQAALLDSLSRTVRVSALTVSLPDGLRDRDGRDDCRQQCPPR